MANQDPADRIAQELADWLELRSTQVANAVLESPYRPRVVEPTTAETVAYFRPLLVKPDNTLNEQGKQQVISQYGANGYEDIAKAVATSIRAEQDATFAAARAEAVAGISGVASAAPTSGPAPAPTMPLQPLRLRPPTNTALMLGQLPEPAAAGPPLLATPGGA